MPWHLKYPDYQQRMALISWMTKVILEKGCPGLALVPKEN